MEQDYPDDMKATGISDLHFRMRLFNYGSMYESVSTLIDRARNFMEKRQKDQKLLVTIHR
jgi:hypothetical protein